ncbi:aromatic alcohol reductase [Aspergillus brunneoviolaceus CBS 621.78]|uniref:NAD(P)-binding protein n=6 Tax=Aspergillus TaxID=5052 RepID=A0A319C7X0_9EURO|nr:NAD(P)-binding protein [Aspergillus brunneoviolaceus CBS 621.78]XP_025490400.1 NAD(P)-binding protein [Aspergillus uvarum CBS 121591]XP_025523535.1 NAD(P)-binding protein [Aspergillus japonicus CBS 114.51]XP_040805013.1 NAD(P)-binding protein [Aspergillus fijiensis CBS 313.89]PYI18552.1 NAD(P)-binding protein [Aspergillus violaceofuscus CBS 115571]PYI28038.1 NAD(P)-binding protein [Aspergillus indologenus CBS 114.80]PYH80200.1 NAD(P)-binding protein [Aspergillus uvarum CBS 121591]RAH41367
MSRTKVLLVGAAGETGGSIANGLLEQPNFEVHALVRPRSAQKPAIVALQERGVQIRKGDLKGPEESLADVLTGIDVVISCVGPSEQQDQIPLAKAAKNAGVQRFVPCGFITVAPPGGIMWLRDEKETVYNHIKQLRLPYTIIDVGWWYQFSYPRLESGRIDYAMTSANNEIVADGNSPIALTDLRDIGRYVAKIITDDRTLNKMVLAYNEVKTQNEIYDLLEEISEEKIQRNYIPEETIYTRVLAARQSSETYPFDPIKFIPRYLAEYQLSWGLRGDNTPEYAKYLGYVTSKELYPDFTPTDFREYLETVVRGAAKGVYTDRTISKAQQRFFPRSESSDSLYTRIFPRTESSDSLYMSR